MNTCKHPNYQLRTLIEIIDSLNLPSLKGCRDKAERIKTTTVETIDLSNIKYLKNEETQLQKLIKYKSYHNRYLNYRVKELVKGQVDTDRRLLHKLIASNLYSIKYEKDLLTDNITEFGELVLYTMATGVERVTTYKPFYEDPEERKVYKEIDQTYFYPILYLALYSITSDPSLRKQIVQLFESKPVSMEFVMQMKQELDAESNRACKRAADINRFGEFFKTATELLYNHQIDTKLKHIVTFAAEQFFKRELSTFSPIISFKSPSPPKLKLDYSEYGKQVIITLDKLEIKNKWLYYVMLQLFSELLISDNPIHLLQNADMDYRYCKRVNKADIIRLSNRLTERRDTIDLDLKYYQIQRLFTKEIELSPEFHDLFSKLLTRLTGREPQKLEADKEYYLEELTLRTVQEKENAALYLYYLGKYRHEMQIKETVKERVNEYREALLLYSTPMTLKEADSLLVTVDLIQNLLLAYETKTSMKTQLEKGVKNSRKKRYYTEANIDRFIKETIEITDLKSATREITRFLAKEPKHPLIQTVGNIISIAGTSLYGSVQSYFAAIK